MLKTSLQTPKNRRPKIYCTLKVPDFVLIMREIFKWFKNFYVLFFLGEPKKPCVSPATIWFTKINLPSLLYGNLDQLHGFHVTLRSSAQYLSLSCKVSSEKVDRKQVFWLTQIIHLSEILSKMVYKASWFYFKYLLRNIFDFI